MKQDIRTVAALRTELTALKLLDRADARGMPAEFYTSEAFLAFEEEYLFRREWICLGHVEEIPNPGDFYTTDLLDELLLVVRGKDGEISVLSNVCRHRGNQVETDRKGNKKRFVCGYHAWAYGLEGELKSAPFMKETRGFDPAKCGLPRFKTEIWQNFIFVNLSGDAAPLAPRMAPLSKLITNYHHEERHLNFMTEEVWETNWKSLVENFMEGYHLSVTHPKTLHPITPTRLCRKFEGGEGFTGYHSFYDPNTPDRTPLHEDMNEEERRSSILSCAYPSFVFSIATNFTLFLCLRPTGAGKVAIRWGLAGYGEDSEDESVKGYVKLCQAFNAEDREKLESLAKALRSRHYKPGPLAPDDYEGTIWDFLMFMANRLGEDAVLAAE